VNSSPGQDGGPESPPPADQKATESLEANQPEVTSGHPTPLSEQLVTASSIPTALRKRLREALGRLTGPRAELTILAGVAPIAVRAAELSTVTAARLELPEAAPDLLGSEVETQILADGERLRIWLAAANLIEPGSTVALIALDTSGELLETTVVTGASHTTIELSLPWDDARLPEAVALVFKQSG
jgi:hypothetical protein